jgi:hypothetical protein
MLMMPFRIFVVLCGYALANHSAVAGQFIKENNCSETKSCTETLAEKNMPDLPSDATATNTTFTQRLFRESDEAPKIVQDTINHDSHKNCHIRGANVGGINSLTISSDNLWLSWQDGQGPYTLKVYDDTGHIQQERQVNNHETYLPIKDLRWNQTYRVELECYYQLKTLELGLDSFELRLNKETKWPEAVLAIKAKDLEETAKMRLISTQLACLDEFRFEALQIADHYGFTALKQEILAGNGCERSP